jgi:hemerythrin-like domain-containing protein
MDEFIKDRHPYLEDFAEVNRVEGITEDYVWYQSKLLANKMNEWQMDFEKLVNVMENRHKEHLKIIRDLLDEIKELKKEKP